MNTPHAPARATYTLTADQAHDLHRAATPWHSGSQARADPIYRDRLNNWWAALGLELGFKWTTVADLTWLAADSRPCAISDKAGEGYGLPDFGEVMSATFTAEPEAAGVPDELDPQAMEWMNRRYCNSGPVTDGCKWSTLEMATAFAAGRDKGFAMGSATVDALEQQLAEAGRLGRQARLLLCDSVNLFRMYERHHRAKVPEHPEPGQAGKATHAALLEKAERNAEIASRIETYLAQAFRWEPVGDPREKDFGTGKAMEPPVLTGQRVTIKAEHGVHVDVIGNGLDQEGLKITARRVVGVELGGRSFAREGVTEMRKPVGVEFKSGDLVFADQLEGNGEWPTEQDEIDTLRQLLADAMPAIEFVNGLATIEDADLDTFAVAQLRDQARGAMGDDGFKRPGTYTKAQRNVAASIFANWWSGVRGGNIGDAVDAIAVALGLRLWTKGGPF